MIDVLLLGATGRTGTALLRHRPRNARLHLGVRIRGGTRPSSVPDGDDVRAIDLTDPVLMRAALSGIDVVVNAIRLPGEIPATALIDLHERIATARDERREEREGPRRASRPPGVRRGFERFEQLGVPHSTARLRPRGPIHRRLPQACTVRRRTSTPAIHDQLRGLLPRPCRRDPRALERNSSDLSRLHVHALTMRRSWTDLDAECDRSRRWLAPTSCPQSGS